MRIGSLPKDWNGAGWFTFDFTVSPDLVGTPIGLSMPRHYGASRIYIDEREVAYTGKLGGGPEAFEPATRPDPVLFEVSTVGPHHLSVLFVNPDVERYHRVGYPGGFNARIESAESAITRARTSQRGAAHRRALFTSVFLAFALLHLLFFLFRPEGARLYWTVDENFE